MTRRKAADERGGGEGQHGVQSESSTHGGGRKEEEWRARAAGGGGGVVVGEPRTRREVESVEAGVAPRQGVLRPDAANCVQHHVPRAAQPGESFERHLWGDEAPPAFKPATQPGKAVEMKGATLPAL